jgi:hypothetical protein
MSRVSDVLKFGDRGLTVEEARRRMLEAGEAPSGRRSATLPAAAADALEPEIEDDGAITVAANPNAAAQATVVVEPEPVAAPPIPAAPPAEDKTERIETEQFVGEIRQEKGRWIAELQYKSGSGTERFVAGSKNELLLELLKGKGHATLRVKEAVRREKLGGPKLDKAYSLPEGVTSEEFSRMSPAAQTAMIDSIASSNAIAWRDARPEYYKTPANGAALNEFMREHNLPFTVANLDYAFEDMTDNDLFPDKRPEAPAPAAAPSLTRETTAPKAEDSAPVTQPAAPASPTPASAAPPAVTTRKRGSTGLPGGHSSVPSDGTARAEDAGEPKEPSEAELRKLPMDELRRIANADRRQRAQVR